LEARIVEMGMLSRPAAWAAGSIFEICLILGF
jgi:hypothetical protein